MKKEDKKTLIGLGVFLLWFCVAYLKEIPLMLLGITNISKLFQILYVGGIQLILIALLIFIYRKDLKKEFKDLKKNHKKYFKNYFKYWFVAIGLMMITNFAIMMLKPGSIAGNEAKVQEMFDSMPIYTFISAVLFAPIMEEIVFRKSFRYMFSNKILFVIVSGLTFGAFHIVGTYSSTFDLLYLIPYSIPGMVFAYTLVKSDNIFVPMGLHFTHNGILMSLQVLLMLLS